MQFLLMLRTTINPGATVLSKGVQSWLDFVNPFGQKWSNPAAQVAVNIDLRKAAK